MNVSMKALAVAGAPLLIAAACASPKPEAHQDGAVHSAGTVYVVKDTTLQTTLEIAGVAAALEQATLSTKLMGSVLEVLVKEGDIVTAGQPLVRIDARDLTAKADQVAASIAEAEAVQREAHAQARRMRALYVDSAATRAQLDAAETGLSRADAGVRATRAAAAELGATTTYAIVRAPFTGTVTKRFVDPGAFAAPGSPLVTLQNGRRLRITASATPDVASRVRRGQSIDATVEGRHVIAGVEGIVPAAAGNLYTINAIVDNPGGKALPGSAATLLVPAGTHAALVIPRAALLVQGDLTGVIVRTPAGDDTRWIRVGKGGGELVEVNAGLRAGDAVIVPPSGAIASAARN